MIQYLYLKSVEGNQFFVTRKSATFMPIVSFYHFVHRLGRVISDFPANCLCNRRNIQTKMWRVQSSMKICDQKFGLLHDKSAMYGVLGKMSDSENDRDENAGKKDRADDEPAEEEPKPDGHLTMPFERSGIAS